MNYKSHNSFNFVLLVIIALCLPFFISSFSIGLIFVVSFLLASIFLSPDLDLWHSKPSQAWSLFRWIWWPYSKLFRHRGISHLPVIGAITRIFYLVLCITLLSFIIQIYLNKSTTDSLDNFKEHTTWLAEKFQIYRTETISGIFGIIAADISHLFADMCSSIKKRF